MSDPEPMRLRRQLIADELRQLERNEAAYRLLLHLCEMLRAWQMPQDDQDDAQGIPLRRWRELQQEKWRLYERFIAKFYRLKLDPAEWEVRSQSPLAWKAPADPAGTGLRLPSMHPDIVLRHRSARPRIARDTKWYKAVAATCHGTDPYRGTTCIRCMPALRRRRIRLTAHTERPWASCTQTREGARRLRTRIDDHPFWMHTLDLRQAWPRIEADLIPLIDEARRPPIRAGDMRADASAQTTAGLGQTRTAEALHRLQGWLRGILTAAPKDMGRGAGVPRWFHGRMTWPSTRNGSLVQASVHAPKVLDGRGLRAGA